MTDWTIAQARATYSMAHWGDGYFDIADNGHVIVRPRRQQGAAIDLPALAEQLQADDLALPVLVRFADILHGRVEELCAAFAGAMTRCAYTADYRAVYPIKVNQQHRVVQEILAVDSDHVGLEAGSKPELMIVLAVAGQLAAANGGLAGATVICNGYKDREYIRLALIGSQLGHAVTIVVENPGELEMIMAESEDLAIKPRIGLRARLASIGKGKWQNTGGEKSKFGLSAAQMLKAVERLRQRDKLDCLQLLHVHLGSQIANLDDVEQGIQEAARFYAELRHLGAPLSTVDVGGGLGIDYEGTRSRSECSMNYSMADYAQTVVSQLKKICSEGQLPEPHIITESGRAMTAHHAVLISNVVDVERIPEDDVPAPHADEPSVIKNLRRSLDELEGRALMETYQSVVQQLAQAQRLYITGELNLAQRALAEQLYFNLCRRIQPLLQSTSSRQHDVLEQLHEKLADKVFANFSVFQSIPDVWAIDQVFPVLPLQRLDEAPTRRAVITDITCDSDGRIDWYVDNEGIESTLPLHAIADDENYLIGIFLVGAYQEILGDMHNLFGDTHSVNVVLDQQGGYQIIEPVSGDNVQQVLRYVNFDADELLGVFRRRLESMAALEANQRQSYLQELEAGLSGYTYLED